MSEPVSPADTILAGITTAHSEDFYRVHHPESCPACQAHAALVELLAVGERDRAELERYEKLLILSEHTFDRIAKLAELNAEEPGWQTEVHSLACDGWATVEGLGRRAKLDAPHRGGESERERARRQIARLTEELGKVAMTFVDFRVALQLLRHETMVEACTIVEEHIRAVLADEEDAGDG